MQTTAAFPERGAPRGLRPARGLGLALLVAVALILLALHLLLWQRAIVLRGGLDAQARQTDFSATLTAALAIRNGQGDRLYDLATQRAAQAAILNRPAGDTLLPYIHPPFEALLVAPLLDLPHGTLYLLWSALAIAAVAAAIALLVWAAPLPGASRWIVLAACLSFSPLWQGLALGQSTPLLLLGLCGTYAALRARREALAGLALALVIIKPQFLLVVALLLILQGRWRTLASCAAVIGLASAAAMIVLGPFWPVQYARFLADIARWSGNHNEYPQIMYNWRGLLVNLLGGGAAPGLEALVALLTIAALGALALAWRRTQAAGGRADALLWALAVPVAVLMTPHLYIHDLTLLILTAWLTVHAIVTGAWRGATARAWCGLLAVGYLLAFASLFRTEDRPGWPVVPGVLVIAALVAILAWRAGRPWPAPEPTPPGAAVGT